jgi:hypothetical protein
MLLYGGGDGDMDFDDLYALDTNTGYWDRVGNATGDPGSRTQAACTVLPQNPASSPPPLDGSAPAADEPGPTTMAVHGGYGHGYGPRSERKSKAGRVHGGHTGLWRRPRALTRGGRALPAGRLGDPAGRCRGAGGRLALALV